MAFSVSDNPIYALFSLSNFSAISLTKVLKFSSFLSIVFFLDAFTLLIASWANSMAFVSASLSSAFILLSRASGAVEYNSSYPASKALLIPNISESSLLYAT